MSGLPVGAALAQTDDKGPVDSELKERRTQTSRTFVNPDGTFTTQMFASPIHYKGGDGQWLPISSEFVTSDEPGFTWRNEANAFDAFFKASAAPDFLRLDVKDRAFSFSLLGAAPASGSKEDRSSQTDNSRLSYRGAFPGVDLEYELRPDGVKETLVLADSNVPSHYRFLLTPPPNETIRTEQAEDGSWLFFMEPFAEPVFIIAPPNVVESWESGQTLVPDQEHVAIDVTQIGPRFAVDLSIDEQWLHDPNRRFPLSVDPTITVPSPVEDASFVGSCPACLPTLSDRLFIGTTDNASYRPAVQFDLGDIPIGAAITNARLKVLYDGWCIAVSGPFCGSQPHQLDAHLITSPWTTSTPSGDVDFDPNRLSTYSFNSSDGGERFLDWDVTNTVTAWKLGIQQNFGLLLKRRTEPLAASGPTPPGRRFAADLEARPHLEVTYAGDGVELFAPETLRANGAELSWSPFQAAGDSISLANPTAGRIPFQGYEIHRAGNPRFTPSLATLLATIKDRSVTTFRDTTAAPNQSFTYKVVVNGSPSNERTVTLPPEGQATKLLQPQPSNGNATYLFQNGSGACLNYGAESTMKLGTSANTISRSLVRFDVSGIPTGADITSATLSLRRSDRANVAATAQLHRVTSAWREGTGRGWCSKDGATWNEANTGIKWASSGGDFHTAAESSVSVPAGTNPSWDDFPAGPLVQKWADGSAPNLGMLLRLNNETLPNTSLSYYADDYSVVPTFRPKLKVTFTDTSEAIAPEVPIGSPGDGATVSGETVRITSAAIDDRRVEKVQFLVDGSPVGVDEQRPFEATWDSTAVANGPHVITAKATDDAGNVSVSANVSIKVENSAPPTTRITNPPPGESVKGTRTVTATANDDLGVTRVEFFLDGIRFAEDATAPYSVSWNTLDPEVPAYDGKHVLTTKAYDTSGQSTTSPPIDVEVVNTVGTKFQALIRSTGVPQAITYDSGATDQETHPVNVRIGHIDPADPFFSDTYIRYRWFRLGSHTSVKDGPLVSLSPIKACAPESCGLPADFAIARVDVAPPPLPSGVTRALYSLRFDLYHSPSGSGLAPGGGARSTATSTSSTQSESDGTFFADAGNEPSDNPVVVNHTLMGEGLGLERYYHYETQDVGAGMRHFVNVANGNSLLKLTPFTAPGRGLSTVVNLTYNSLEEHSGSTVGNNFSLSISSLNRLGLPIDIHPNRADEIAGRSNKWVEFVDGDGTTHRFEGRTGADGTTYWEEPAGVHLYLREFSSADPNRKWALTRPDRVTFFYDIDGYPTGLEDKNGNRLNFTLEPVPSAENPGGIEKRVVRVTDAAGVAGDPVSNRSFTIDYYARTEAEKPQIRGKIQRITDHSGHSLSFAYYEDGNLLSLTEHGGTTADGSHLPDRRFVFTYMSSDGSGPAIPLAVDRVNPDPRTSPQGSLIYSVRDLRGNETLFGYLVGPEGDQNRRKLASITDRSGAQTSYAYDIATRTTTVSAPLSRTRTYVHDQKGHVTRITDALNRVTSLEWNADRHLTKLTEPGGAFREFAYNANGFITDIYDQLRNHTTLTYDNIPVDVLDVAGKWKAGRAIPHISQIVTKTSPRGNETPEAGDFTWRFGYDDVRGNLTSLIDPTGAETRYLYNVDGTLRLLTDARGNITRYESYDANGLATEIVDAEGGVTKLGYDATGLLQFIQDPEHARFDGQPTPANYRSQFFYDSFHRLGLLTEPKSTELEPGVLIRSNLDHDANNNVIASFTPAYNARGPKTTIEFDSMDRRTSVTEPDKTADPDGERTVYDYDAAGRVIKITSPKGVKDTSFGRDFAVEMTYDLLDRVKKESTFQLDANGAVQTTLNTHYCYNTPGDLVSVTLPNAGLDAVDCSAPTIPSTKRFEYDAAHRLKAQIDPEGRRRSFEYDANGNRTSVTLEHGKTNLAFYDERDRIKRRVEAFDGTRTVTSRAFYDGVGNLIRQVSPRSNDASAKSGDPSATKEDFEDFSTSYVYDGLNRLVRTDLPTSAGQPQRHHLHRSYDRNGNLLWTSMPVLTADPTLVTDDKRSVMTYFDPGWVATSRDPSSPTGPNRTVRYDYDARGLQTLRAATFAGKQRITTWSYFDDGLVSSVADRRDESGDQQMTYEYDPNDNLKRATDSTGITHGSQKPVIVEVTYDGFDRVAKAREQRSEDANWRFTTFVYDPNGNVAERRDDGKETTAGSQVEAPRVHHFTYDASDRLTQHIDDGKAAVSTDDQKIETTYTPVGWESRRAVSRKNGGTWALKQTTDWTYFDNGKLKTLVTKNGSGVVKEDHTLSYINAAGTYLNGNRTKDVFTLKGPDAGASCQSSTCTMEYVYDPRDRLVTLDRTGYGPDIDYELNVSGNIVTEKHDGAINKSYTYDGDRIQTVTSEGTTVRHFYDDFGNLDCITVAAGTQSDCRIAEGEAAGPNVIADYTYDPFDRLTRYRKYSSGTKTDDATYINDALDRVFSQTETHGSTTHSTDFTYIGTTRSVTSEVQKDGSGATKTEKSYSYGAFGNRISMTDDPGGATGGAAPSTFTYAHDPHGSVSLLLEDGGGVKASYGYDPYGEEDEALSKNDTSETDPFNPFRYSARRFDSGSEGYDMGARRFDPGTAHFLQLDQYQGALADVSLSLDPLTQNRYALAAGNPVGYVEWDGHVAMMDGGGGSQPTTGMDGWASWATGSSGGGTGRTSGERAWIQHGSSGLPGQRDFLQFGIGRVGNEAERIGREFSDYARSMQSKIRTLEENLTKAQMLALEKRYLQLFIRYTDVGKVRDELSAALRTQSNARLAGRLSRGAGGLLTGADFALTYSNSDAETVGGRSISTGLSMLATKTWAGAGVDLVTGGAVSGGADVIGITAENFMNPTLDNYVDWNQQNASGENGWLLKGSNWTGEKVASGIDDNISLYTVDPATNEMSFDFNPLGWIEW